MKLGFITACLPRRTLPQLCEWARRGLRGAGGRRGPDLGDRPFTATHLAVERFGDAEADATRELFAKHGLGALVYRALRQQPPPGQHRAGCDQRARRPVHRRRGPGGLPDRRHLRGPRSHPVGGRQPPRGRGRLPSAGRSRRRGGREAHRRELRHGGLAPRRLPGQPRLLARAVGVDVRPRAVPQLRPVPPGVDGHRPGRGATALHRPHPPRAGQGHPGRRAARNRYGWPGRAVVRDDPWDVGWWRYRVPGLGQVDWVRLVDTLYEGGFDGVLSVEHEDPGGAARRRRSRSACGSPTTRCAPCWWPDGGTGDPVLEVRGLVKEYPGVRPWRGSTSR